MTKAEKPHRWYSTYEVDEQGYQEALRKLELLAKHYAKSSGRPPKPGDLDKLAELPELPYEPEGTIASVKDE